MKRRNNHGDNDMIRCRAASSSYILGIVFAIHCGASLLPSVNCSLRPHANYFARRQLHPHQHLWRRRRGVIGGSSGSSRLSFIHSIRGGSEGGGGGTRVVEANDEICEDKLFAIEEAKEYSTCVASDPGSNSNNNCHLPEMDTEGEEEIHNENMVEGVGDDKRRHEGNDTTETIHVVKKDGTLQPLEKNKVSSCALHLTVFELETKFLRQIKLHLTPFDHVIL